MDFTSFKNQFENVPVVENDNLVTNKPLVSICVQTYQHVDFISECLDSILKQQTDFPFEIILGEDESTDGTGLICEGYANKFSDKIRFFSHKRKNNILIKGKPSGRFNMMYNLYSSNGKYIALCEGDDYWVDPLKLQKQVDALESNPCLIACHHWQKYAIFKNGDYVEVDAPIDEGHGYYPALRSSVVKIFSNQMNIKSRTLMFRNIIDDTFFPDWFYKVAFGDISLSFLLAKYGDFGFIDEPMAVYRQTGEGVSTKGLKELGPKKFMVQHYKNWIQISDFADKHYNYKYHKQANKTVKYYFTIMIDNLPKNAKGMFHLLKYNVVIREMSIFKTLMHTLWMLSYYGKFSLQRLKRNLQKLRKKKI
jgi:glycosyltransferase involved in cell wall biosynthesis